jgi:NADH dehydrogenase
MFGPDDAFLNTLVQLLRRLPIYPMFGRGETRLQPADVEDVGEAVARLMQRAPAEAITVECGGPHVYTYEELLKAVARAANVTRVMAPVPFAAWHGLAWFAEKLPRAPITRNGFADLGISPRAVEEVLQSMLRRAWQSRWRGAPTRTSRGGHRRFGWQETPLVFRRPARQASGVTAFLRSAHAVTAADSKRER